MDSRELFAKTPPLRLFFIAALPGAVSMLASALYQMLDGVFVGQYLGETAFAALNLAMPFVIINFALADLIGVGSAVPISVNLGKGEKREANNIFTCACIMIIIAGTAVGALLYAFAPALMALMGAEGEFAALAVQYMRVYALCSPVTTIIFAVDNYLRICGYIRGSMWLNILMSALSAVLEFLFLGVFNFGIWGAALATSLGMLICVLIAFVPFLRGWALLSFTKPRFSMAMTRQIVSCGSPNFLNNIAGRITSIIMNAILVRLGGETAVSVYGILMFADGFIQPLLYGMCDSLQPAVGYNWGARAFSRVRAIEKCCFTASAVVSLGSTVLVALIPGLITRLFVSDPAPEVMEMSVTALRIFALTYITRWFSFATQSYMLAIEKALPASLISVSTALVFPVLLIAALYPLGLTGIWMNFPLTSVLAGVMSIVILKKLRAGLNRPDAPQEE
ncbi:MAG TPA: MATE family efflux transporter [Candidatus Scatomorpha intestinavium]|uniref:MATE family efflux transporter n=1 Tax=Candidatus Scatomorpha intestinavium TaxID=2840922 RepID=A0A9D1CRT3_9FIRM|nr:MATE family efflux transporter [Candidatus Scatomorpha intestinavium]